MANEAGNKVNICAETVPTLFGSKRPRIWLRRCRPEHRPLVREYILNKGTQAEAISLANLEALYAGEPVAVP
jgi:hypothetical protein